MSSAVQKMRRDKNRHFKGEHAGCSVVVGEDAISTQNVFSDDLSRSFYDLVQ